MPASAYGSKHTGDGNLFMGVVELPKGAIIVLELSIDNIPTNMQTKVLIEAKLYGSHKCGEFDGLVRLSNLV